MSSRLRSGNSTRISFFAFQDIITSVSGILILVVLILATDLDRPSESPISHVETQLEAQLRTLLGEQGALDAQNELLQQALTASQTAPAPAKLEADIAALRAALLEQERTQAAAAEAQTQAQAALSERDRALGLTGLAARTAEVKANTHASAAQEDSVRQAVAKLEAKVTAAQARLLKLRDREGQIWLTPDQHATTKEPILVTVSGKSVIVERFDRPEQRKQHSEAEARAGFKADLNGFRPQDQYVVFQIRPSGIELFQDLRELARKERFEVGFDALAEAQQIHFSKPPEFDQSESAMPPGAPPIPPPPRPEVTPSATTPVPAAAHPPPAPAKKSWWRRLLE